MSLSDRLKQARKNANKTQGEVAEAVGIKQPTYQALESGKNAKSAFIPQIARFLNVDVHWLQDGVGEMQGEQKQIKTMDYRPPVEADESPPTKETPVISWVQAGDFTAVISAGLDHVIRYIPYNPRAGKYGFALIVNGASMEPDFKANEFIYINPTFQIDELHTGSLVVMACDGDTEATFKELVAEGGRYYMRPLNPNWHEKIIPLDHTCRLVGKVVGKYVEYN